MRIVRAFDGHLICIMVDEKGSPCYITLWEGVTKSQEDPEACLLKMQWGPMDLFYSYRIDDGFPKLPRHGGIPHAADMLVALGMIIGEYFDLDITESGHEG